MLYEHQPTYFTTPAPRVHGTFERMRIEVAQIPSAEPLDEEMTRHGWLGMTDPYATVVAPLVDSGETVGQAGAGIDGGFRSGAGAVRVEWAATIPDDGPPTLRMFADIDGNSDGILIADCDPVRDYLALAVLARRRRLLIDSTRMGIDGVPLHLLLLIDPVPTEGLRQVADYPLESADRQEELWWGTGGQQP
jgi:hypothetical protein